MVYGGSPSTDDTDAVRLLIGDTSTSSPVLTDTEVDYYISTYGNLLLAASYALEGIVANQGGSVSEKQVGDLRIKYESAGGSGGLAGLAKSLRVRAARTSGNPYAGGISIADKDSVEADSDRVSPSFTVGQDDNPSVYTTEEGIMDWR